jgi:hypothetical protein
MEMCCGKEKVNETTSVCVANYKTAKTGDVMIKIGQWRSSRFSTGTTRTVHPLSNLADDFDVVPLQLCLPPTRNSASLQMHSKCMTNQIKFFF